MHFQIITVAALTALSSALPTLKVRQSGPVLADTTYDAISISGGQAGKVRPAAGASHFRALRAESFSLRRLRATETTSQRTALAVGAPPAPGP